MFTPTTSPVQLLHSTASAAAAARGAASPRSGSALLIAVLRARACLAPSEHRTAPNQTFSAEKRAWVLTVASPRRNGSCSASPSRPTWRRQRPRVGLRAGSAPGRRHAAVALRALSGAPIALESWSLDPFVELFRNDSQFFNASFKQNPSENGASIKYDF